MKKIYLTANDYLRDCWRLGRSILDSGWVPDELIALWRGGAPVGVSVHEYLYYHHVRPRHHVVKCHSYAGLGQRNETVVFEDGAEIFDKIAPGARVLVLDDVFDSGRTAEAVVNRLKACSAVARVATVYWKPAANRTVLKPDYFVRQVGEWLVFPHEMDGLTADEIREKDPALFGLLRKDLLDK